MDLIQRFKEVKKTFSQGEQELAEIRKEIDKLETDYQNKIKTLADRLHLTGINEERFKGFLDEPYVLLPTGKKEEWYVAVPKFIRMNLGWLDFTTDSYNVFRINKFMDWLGEIPDSIRDKFKFKPKLPLKIYDGMLLTGTEHQDDAWNRYKQFLSRREGKEKIRVKRGYEFNLIAKLIDDGILPFIAQPVDKADLRKPEVGFELRDYQLDAHKRFLKTGAVGIFWAHSAGKTFLGMYECAEIEGKKLVVVPTTTLVEQWQKRLKEYTKVADEVDVVTYHSYHKIQDKEYALAIFDECHCLPANQFSKFSTIRAKYRIGCSGSPYREDGRSVDGNEPILIKYNNKITMSRVKEIIDSYYNEDNDVPITVDGLQVLSLDFDNFKIRWSPVEYVSRHKPNKILKIKLETGREIKLTPAHSLMTLNNNFNIISKKTSELKKGDVVVIPRNFTIEHDLEIDENLPKIIGAHIADGSMTKSNGYYSVFSFDKNNDISLISDISTCLKNIGFNPTVRIYGNEAKVGVYRKEFYNLMSTYGFERTNAHTKRVPHEVFSWSSDNQKSLVDYYMRGDAGVSVNKALLSDFMYLGMHYGQLYSLHNSFSKQDAIFPDGHLVKGRQRFMLYKNKERYYGVPFGIVRDYYSLIRTKRRENIKYSFAETIKKDNINKFFGTELKRRLELLNCFEKGVNTKDLKKKYGKTISNWGYVCRYFEKRGLVINPQKRNGDWLLSEKGKLFLDGHRRFNHLLEGDITFVKVLSIEETNNHTEFAYDFHVPFSQTFVAGLGGILCHNTDYIFALTGFPIGLSWENLIELGIIEKPDIRLYIFKHWRDKENKLKELLAIKKKTLVFCDSITIGKRIARQHELPFVYGDTKDRLDVIDKSDVTIVSRVADEGVSLPDIERVIELDFLYGSRRQEVQRMGRLLHGKSKGEHVILMTESEYDKYNKRLFSLYEKGFKIEIVR